MCKKKLKLMDKHKCLCGKTFCTKHRHDFEHNCSMKKRVRQVDIDKLAKNLIKLESNKNLTRI